MDCWFSNHLLSLENICRNIQCLLFSDNSCQGHLRTRDGQVWEDPEVLHLFVQERQRSGTQEDGRGGRKCNFSEPT